MEEQLIEEQEPETGDYRVLVERTRTTVEQVWMRLKGVRKQIDGKPQADDLLDKVKTQAYKSEWVEIMPLSLAERLGMVEYQPLKIQQIKEADNTHWGPQE